MTPSSWALTPCDPQQSRSRINSNCLWPGGSSSLSSITFLVNFSLHFHFSFLRFASPTHRVPDRLRLQLRRLYAPPEAGSSEVVSSEAQDNCVYHMRIWNNLGYDLFWLQQQRDKLPLIWESSVICCLLKMWCLFESLPKVAELHDHWHPRQPWPPSDSNSSSTNCTPDSRPLSIVHLTYILQKPKDNELSMHAGWKAKWASHRQQ